MLTIEKEKLAQLLFDAKKNAKEVDRAYRQKMTLEEAYDVQRELTKLKVASGQRVIGKKIGFTGKAMRKQFNIDQPDYGSLFADELFVQGTPIDTSKFISPKVEGEIAFLMKEDLKGPNCNVYDVLRATEGVMACLEFVDGRWGTDGITFIDSVADNGGCGGFLLGSKMLRLVDLDLRAEGMYMLKNGELMASGCGVEVLGDPLNAVAWLADCLARHGDYIHAGDILLSGALCGALPAAPGDNMSICFSRLGTIDIKFV